ncbi:CPBP family intramembrane glutamic endopeptidase [Anthocerotibacter panamensis]|uniref:CPBP family intramembrane glutamic endopeptidase n=1 Tax=Anthocerotibacter panamensis TaxID=2857077 RepID=UPI001C4053EA|nr:CPBP family intramembrane glutamic endopeptidase [Anthocerotibacter panamensis]
MNLAPLLLVLVFLVATVVLWLPIGVLLLGRRGWQWGAFTFAEKLQWVLSLYLVIPPVLWGLAEYLGLSFARSGFYGLRVDLTGGVQLLAGLGLGLLGLVVLFGGEVLLGWAQWKHPSVALGLIGSALGVGIGVGAVEELLFRGFMVQAFLPYGLWGAALLSSAIFALLHLIWEPAGTRCHALFQLPGLGLMGLVLVWAVILADGSLNLAWGLHAGWVWGMTVLDTAGALDYPGQTPAWVTGIGGKPLAGMLGLGFLGLTAATLWAVHWYVG